MRVRRTFAFLDLSGFTALTATEGDEHSVAVVEVFRGTLRRTCSRRAVRIAKWLGDGAMLVAVDPAPVVAAALEMQHTLSAGVSVGNQNESTPARTVPVKCGITTGPVILLEGDDYIGHAVNLAARLCDLAGEGEILCDPSLADALPPWAEVADTGEMVVRGVEHPVEVVRLGLYVPGGADASLDPVCGIPLTDHTAVAKRAAGGVGTWLFCSDSCLDTWQSRPSADMAKMGPLGLGSATAGTGRQGGEDWVREPLG